MMVTVLFCLRVWILGGLCILFVCCVGFLCCWVWDLVVCVGFVFSFRCVLVCFTVVLDFVVARGCCLNCLFVCLFGFGFWLVCLLIVVLIGLRWLFCCGWLYVVGWSV